MFAEEADTETIFTQFSQVFRLRQESAETLRHDLEYLKQAGTVQDFCTIDDLEVVIARVLNLLYVPALGSVTADEVLASAPIGVMKLPADFLETPVGILVSEARAWTYPDEDFCVTQKEASEYLDRDRSSLRNYEDAGLIHPVYRQRGRQYLWRELMWMRDVYLPSIAKGA